MDADPVENTPALRDSATAPARRPGWDLAELLDQTDLSLIATWARQNASTQPQDVQRPPKPLS